MKLYFSPLACSLASRIALYEAGADATFVEIDPKTKTTPDGEDFRARHMLGMVPLLELDDGSLLSENAAILQYIARTHADARLIPDGARGLAQVQQWLSFVGSELHKATYVPLLDKTAPAEVKAYALSKVELRFTWLARQLEGRAFLADEFSIADCYLFAVLNWSSVTPVSLDAWPAVRAYHARLRDRPHVARAFTEELELYARELKRQGN